jgi:hypothetical protein
MGANGWGTLLLDDGSALGTVGELGASFLFSSFSSASFLSFFFSPFFFSSTPYVPLLARSRRARAIALQEGHRFALF